MSISRVINTDIWDDELVSSFSPEDRYFWLYLLTNPHTTQLGIYHLPLKKACVELGYSIETVKILLNRFEQNYGLIRFNPNTSEIAIKNFLKHSILKGGKPVMDCLLKEETKVKDKDLIVYIVENVQEKIKCGEINNITVKEFINYLASKYFKTITNNINDNDNDNERIVPRFIENNNKSFKKPSVTEVQAYCDERGNGISGEEFVDYYTSKGWMIGKNVMKDWKSAVRTWEHKRGFKVKEEEHLLQPKGQLQRILQ